MSKTILSLALILGVLVFVTSSNFKFSSGNGTTGSIGSDSSRFGKPHDVFPPNVNKAPLQHPYPPLPGELLVYPNVDISNNTAPQNEPSVKISKKNPNRVVAAWRDFRLGVDPNAVRRVGYSYSTDGGTTWSVGALIDSTLLGGGLLRNSDPAVATDTAGNFYITTIALDNFNNNGTVGVFKSTDGGVTFPIGVIAAQTGSEDKEYITCDFTPGSPYKNNLYISWTRFSGNTGIKCMRSTNGGLNWSAAANVSTSSTTGQGSDPVVGANGEVYIVWVGGFSDDIQYFSKSTDGGLTFSTPANIAEGTTPNIPWSAGWSFPSIAADITGGPRNGNIYVAFCDARNGDPDVFLIRSTDHGGTWSAPARVNNDGIGNGKIQTWPWIAVNDSGNIAIVYYDTRNTPSSSIIEAWLATSTDGGQTFTNSVLSTVQSPTNTPGSNVRFGDYIGLDFWRNRIVPVWTDERAGGFDMDIYTATITFNPEPPLPSLCEGFSGTTFPPQGWSVIYTGSDYWSQATVSAWCLGTKSAEFDFYDAINGTQQSLVTKSFQATTGNTDSLVFMDAYATYTNENDQLIIYSSTDNGVSFNPLVTLNGGVSGELVTAPPQQNPFTPTCTQWKRQVHVMPIGTNKLKFTALSAFGNNLYVDSICVVTFIGITPLSHSIPKVYSLSQNYPNPFNPSTMIKYGLPKAGLVKIIVYDILGREVKILVNEVKAAGNYEVVFNGSSLSSGVYFYRIEAGDFRDVKKMVLVK